MARRPLSAAERTVWNRVAASARPLPGRAVPVANPEVPSPPEGVPPLRQPQPSAPRGPVRAAVAGGTLDAGWDRRLATGRIAPERSIDLHGETASSAHVRLLRGLAAAIRDGVRVVLVIAGRPPRDNPRLPPERRGVIRASLEDWLAASPYAGAIAAIRNAHPRHGGAGAVYVILRRARP